MKSRPELERLAGYLTDFVASLPSSTRAAVGTDIQNCITVIAREIEQQYAVTDSLPKEPQPESV